MESNNTFNPKRLREARIVWGLTITDLAEKIGVSKQAISQFELGDSIPKAENMMAIVNTLKFPKSFFFSEYKEQHVGNTFFRAYSTLTKKSRDVQLIKAQWAAHIHSYLDQYIDFPTVDLPDTAIFNGWKWEPAIIESLANHVRNSWCLGGLPISNMVSLLEQHGILVSTLDVGHEKMDAFCQPRQGNKPLIIFSNDKQSAVRRQFDGAHELGHLLMHKDEIDNQELLTKDEFKTIETQADRFASAFLLPAETFRKTVQSTSIEDFVELKKYWKVSIAAMIRRCKDLEIISESRYTSLQKQLSLKHYKKKEPLDDVFPVPAPTALNKSIRIILENNVKSAFELVQEINLPTEVIESLCNLLPGTLAYHKENETDAIIKLKPTAFRTAKKG